jgi:hypothetical protein
MLYMAPVRPLMHPTELCIVARPMSRPTDGTRLSVLLGGAVVCLIALVAGLYVTYSAELEAREAVRNGNRLFKDTRFIEAAAQYQRAVKDVDEPIVHFNLGLAYSKAFKPGYEKPIRIGVQGDFICSTIPGTKPQPAQVCLKPGDMRFDDCDEKNVCASSYRCEKTTLCTVESVELANMAADHFKVWINAQPSDEEINKQLKAVNQKLDKIMAELQAQGKEEDKQRTKPLEDEIDHLLAKDQIRKLMTQVWMDSSQFNRALEYWSGLLKERPTDTEIMGNLAGINLKANDWRKSIEWYQKVAETATDSFAKVTAYQAIGNVAWSKLNSKLLATADNLELADRGIGALQKAIEIQPKNVKLFQLQASLFGFRGLVQGASWAAALDRATLQDLQGYSRVLREEAKKAQEQGAGTPTTPNPAPVVKDKNGQGAKTGG